MFDLTNIHSLTDFNRNTKAYVQRLKETGTPEVLTVNGQAEIVVQSAAAYQQLREAADLVERLPILRQSLEEAKLRQGRPARDVLRELAAKAGFDLDK